MYTYSLHTRIQNIKLIFNRNTPPHEIMAPVNTERLGLKKKKKKKKILEPGPN